MYLSLVALRRVWAKLNDFLKTFRTGDPIGKFIPYFNLKSHSLFQVLQMPSSLPFNCLKDCVFSCDGIL